MTRFLTASALTGLALIGVSAAELAPKGGYSIRLARFEGVIYYTVEEDGYHVVATLASGADEQPIRFVSTLGPGQRIVISVPQGVDEPRIDLEIVRSGDAVLVNDLGFPAGADRTPVAFGK